MPPGQSTPGQISILGVTQGDLLVNTYQIKALTDQIRYTDACAALQQIIEQAMTSIVALIAGIVKNQLAILADYFPILELPFPDPFSIVKWIKKLVFGTASTQFMAYVRYAIQLIQLASALADLIEAIEEALANANCNISLDPTVVFRNQLEIVNSSIDTALAQIAAKQVDLQKVVGSAATLTTFDTSSPTNFIQSVNANIQQFQLDAAFFMGSSVAPDVPATAGQVFRSNADGSVYWGDSLANTTSFTSSGTFTVPENVTKIKVTVVGGGGGGAGSDNKNYGGSGGFASGYIDVTPGQVITATVGTGGASTGADGGDSSFEGLVATGGKGATTGGSGDGENGTGTGGSLNLTGSTGESTHLLKGKGGYGNNSAGKDGLIIIEH